MFPCLAPDLCPALCWGKVQVVPEPEPHRDFLPTARHRVELRKTPALLVLVPLPPSTPQGLALSPALPRRNWGCSCVGLEELHCVPGPVKSVTSRGDFAAA